VRNAAQAYLKTKVTTSSQSHLVIMLYDGAITALEQAKEKILERDYARKGLLISRAMDVIAELDCSLNSQKGGEIAQNLHSLYFYCSTRLLSANMNLDTAILDEVIAILSGLRSAFAEIIGQEATTHSGTSLPAPHLSR
jgi:flagellar secretion chaperone FliS